MRNAIRNFAARQATNLDEAFCRFGAELIGARR
jgi:hypothetical protein